MSSRHLCRSIAMQSLYEWDFYDKEYILDFLESRREQLTGVAITGGDPLVHGEAIPPTPRLCRPGQILKCEHSAFLVNVQLD